MEKIVERNLLYDFYGDLLTQHQRNIYEDAVFGDLSLAELAEDHGITRQGVHDLIKRCDAQLMGYENKLHLVDKFIKIKGLAEEISRLSSEISDDRAKRISELSSDIRELL